MILLRVLYIVSVQVSSWRINEADATMGDWIHGDVLSARARNADPIFESHLCHDLLAEKIKGGVKFYSADEWGAFYQIGCTSLSWALITSWTLISTYYTYTSRPTLLLRKKPSVHVINAMSLEKWKQDNILAQSVANYASKFHRDIYRRSVRMSHQSMHWLDGSRSQQMSGKTLEKPPLMVAVSGYEI